MFNDDLCHCDFCDSDDEVVEEEIEEFTNKDEE